MPQARPLNVLFLCTGNSCRSIMGEALMNHLENPRVNAFSAGSAPTGSIHPKTLSILGSKGLSTSCLRSKSWEEFADIPLDVVIPVSDNAAGEACPFFPGAPVKGHWGVPDPAHATWSEVEIRAAFEGIFNTLFAQFKAFLSLPSEISKEDVSLNLKKIGEIVS
jgi:arsenate reductase